MSQCECQRCATERVEFRVYMHLCSVCGNKRCPKATDCRHACTGSNDPGQPGSSYQLSTSEQAALKRALMRSVVILPERCPYDDWRPARDVA